jgi:hypothetical protein
MPNCRTFALSINRAYNIPMTYVVAFKQPNMNAIIADCRVTSVDEGIGEDARLKIGFLAPGIIFARVGSDERSSQFISRFRQSLQGISDNEQSYWKRLEAFVSAYGFPFEGNDYFQLVLSTRAFGEPGFFELDSLKGELRAFKSGSEAYIKTYGSGKKELDGYLFGKDGLPHPLDQSFVQRLESVMAEYETMGVGTMTTLRHLPYYICLWLSELTQTGERARMNAVGVGGPFHFIYQTRDLEATQDPAVYVLTRYDFEPAFTSSSLYRVAFLNGGLFVESFLYPDHDPKWPDGRYEHHTIFDISVRDDLLDYRPERDEAKLHSDIERELASLPYYKFCCLGYWHPYERERTVVLYNLNGSRDDIYHIVEGKGTQLAPELVNYVMQNFQQVLEQRPDLAKRIKKH